VKRAFLFLPVVSLVALAVGMSLAASAWASGNSFDEPGGISGGGVELSSVSCTGVGACTAVGGGGYVTETNGTWGTFTEISDSAGLTGVSCTDAVDCTAVGADASSPIYVTETNGTWGPVTEISAPNGYGIFNGVSCTDLENCVAVGWGEPPVGESGPQLLYATETNGTWGPVIEIPAPGPAPGLYGAFQGVSCTATGYCTAVGYDGGSAACAAIEPIYVTETNGTWGPVQSVSVGNALAGGCGELLKSVSCADATNCTAIGPNGGYATETNGIWSTIAEIPGAGGLGSFNGVSCTGPGDCTAVGESGQFGAEQELPLYVSETNGVWGPITEVALPPHVSSVLHGVSCTGPGDCTAVGEGFREEHGVAAGSGPVESTTEQHVLNVSDGGTGTGTVSSSLGGVNCGAECSGRFSRGAEVTLTATPAAGSTFTGWSGACSGVGTCEVTLSEDRKVTATFTKIPTHSLTVALAGSGKGAVSGTGAISCPGVCSQSYAVGEIVTLTATPTPGSTFTGWSGGGCSGTGTCEATMSSDRNVTATFTMPESGGGGGAGGASSTSGSGGGGERGGASQSPISFIRAHPKVKTKVDHKAKVKFTFYSNEAGATFECKLDKRAFGPCSSPKTYRVKRGKHVFSVEATNLTGQTGIPARFHFKVIRRGHR
jgi:Divergent InlB B-repeat domain